jgi:hypothetical protein
VTPKLAVATPARVSAMAAVALAPPYEAWIVAVVGALTTWVNTLKAALVLPGNTVTIAGTTAIPSLESATIALSIGAGAVKVTIAVTFEPPTTVDGLTVRDASFAAADTVSVGDCRLLPFIAAVIVAVPDVRPHTENVAVITPGATSIEAGTVATAGLLLDNPTVAPVLPTVLASVTVP